MKKFLFLALLAIAYVCPMQAQTHDVQLTATLATSCNSATPCYTEIYRVQVASSTALCPTTLTSYLLIASSLFGTTVTNTGTTTVYDDQDSTLKSGASYCYTVTDQYISGGGGESAMGPTALVTFPAPPAAPQGITAVIKK